MPEPFVRLDGSQFIDLIARFPFRRRIASVHMHHTWKPRRRDHRGLATILAMRDFHVNTNGWSDIAQHVTIDPEGGIWTGRDWNRSPASASGFNGSAVQGPFMFEMIGNFDRGEDPFDGAQRDAAMLVVAAVQLRFGLAPTTLRFHRDMSRKTCPGSGIDYADVLRRVTETQAALRDAARTVTDSWATPAALASRDAVDGVILAAGAPLGLQGRATGNGVAAEEPAEEEMSLDQQLAMLGDHDSVRALRSREGRGERGAELTPAMLDGLRHHVVNLRQGRLSTGGRIRTSVRDLDAMFAELDRWVAGATDGPRRIVLYAHGGLVSEASGLRVALNHVDWWKANEVYPIYFVWETGFVETLAQMLVAGAERERAAVGARDLSDVSDWLIERAARVPGPGIWGTMKRSAERAFDDEGDQRGAENNARAVIRRLIALCARHPSKVELHGVGHSAGAIFQAHLLGAYEAMRSRAAAGERAHLPRFTSLQLLAPAATAELYLRRLHPLIGGAVDRLSIFTMQRRTELDDNCIGLYRKSLLYLIYHALEDRSDTDILGLQESLEAPELREAFEAAGPAADIVYSPTPPGSEAGRSASRAARHGSFDEDGWTMTSVLCRVVDRDPHQVRRAYPDRAGRGAAGDVLGEAGRWITVVSAPGPSPTPVPAVTPGPQPAWPPPVGATSGRRRALCVGIDRYPTAPLFGCVHDAEAWADLLGERFGFESPVMLRNEEANREQILGQLRDLVTSAKSGDVLVFAYAGHGTELPDLDSDEGDEGTNGPKDEALCPHDFADGAFLIDDDLRQVLTQIPEGVSLTCFFDCCHSGTSTRFAVGATRPRAARGDRRPRFVQATPQLIEAHARFRAEQAPSARGVRASEPGGREQMRHVLFSACMDSEVAYEEGGAGAFTGHAATVLRSTSEGLTNAQFQERVTGAFGPSPAQHPQIDCAPGWEGYGLLRALAGSYGEIAPVEAEPSGRGVVHQALESLLTGNGSR
jgi:hypothetical protein